MDRRLLRYYDRELRHLQSGAREFARERLLPFAAEWDRTHAFPAEALREMGELGFFGMLLPEAYGGSDIGQVAYALALEEIAAGDGACSTIMSVHNSVACMPILRFGTEEQKRRFLPQLASGRWIGGQQLDFDFSDPYEPLFGIWDGDNPGHFIEIDLSSVAEIPVGRITDITDSGVVILQSEGQKAYRWDAASGLVRLPSMHETDENAGQFHVQEAEALAISADGSVVVGMSGFILPRRATVWTASGVCSVARTR